VSTRRLDLRFSTICGLVIAMGLATAAFFDPLPWWMPVPLVALGLWRLWPAWQGREAPAVGRTAKYALLLSMTALLWASGRLGLGLDGAGAMFIVLLWSKLLELHSARDLQRTCAIALFLVSANLLVSQSLAQCLFAALTTIAVLAVLVQRQLVGRAARADAPPPPPPPPGEAYAAWSRSWKLCGVLALQAAPFTLLLFLCVPRPSLLEGLDRRNGRSGITDHLEPGSLAHLALDRGLAFRATFMGNALPAPQDEYWRGLVLWSTDGETWGRHLPGSQTEPPREQRREIARGPTLTYEITIEPHGQPWIYTLDCPLNVQQSELDTYEQQVGFVWAAKYPIGSTRLYTATSVLGPASDQPIRHAIDYLAVNDGGERDPRLTALVSELRESSRTADGFLDPAQAVEHTLDWFRHMNFIYTLDPGAMGAHATETFLFERRQGFCEHYAAAFSLVMRLIGVPSRVVVGYLGGEVNPIGGFIDVRNSNAHAWSEVWIRGEGWRRVDATLVVAQVDQAGNTLAPDDHFDTAALAGSGHHWWDAQLKALSNRWDYVEAQWDRWALAYDQDSLATLMSYLHLGALGMAAPLVVLVAVAIPSLALVARIMRRRRYGRQAHARLWGRLTARLEHHGLVRDPAEGPSHFAARAGMAFPQHAATLAAFAADHALLAYGPPLPPPEHRQVLTRLRHALRQLRFSTHSERSRHSEQSQDPPFPPGPGSRVCAHRPGPPSTSQPSP